MRRIALVGFKGEKAELIAGGSNVQEIRKQYKTLKTTNCGEFDNVFIYETYTKRAKSIPAEVYKARKDAEKKRIADEKKKAKDKTEAEKKAKVEK